MAEYYIFSGRLFEKGKRKGNTDVRETRGGLTLVKEYPLTPLSTTLRAVIYTFNLKVLPVLSLRDVDATFR